MGRGGKGRTDSLLEQHAHDLGALVSLELDDLAHLIVIDKTAVAGEFLCKRNDRTRAEWVSASDRAERLARWKGQSSLLNAFKSFLGSYSVGTPWRVVIVLRPFLCWIRMWMWLAVRGAGQE